MNGATMTDLALLVPEQILVAAALALILGGTEKLCREEMDSKNRIKT